MTITIPGAWFGAPESAEPDVPRRRSQLTTCDGADLTTPVADLVRHLRYTDPRDASQAVEELFANPDLTFEQFVRILHAQLDLWIRSPSDGGAEPVFSVDPWAPGSRSSVWWRRALCADGRVSGGEFSAWWHRLWLMRRAFVVTEPEHWPQLWEACSWLTGSDHVTSERLLALLRHRSLGWERERLVAEPEDVDDSLFDGWQQPWDVLREQVPRRTTRAQAQAGLSAMLLDPIRDPQRATLTQQVRRVLVAEILQGRPKQGYHQLDRRFAALTADDVRTIVTETGSCVEGSQRGWSDTLPWWRNEVEQARTSALGLVPLDDPTLAQHLTCPVADHRVQMVLNPFVPWDVAAAAIATEMRTARSAAPGRRRPARDEFTEHTRRWWRTLLAVRGWMPLDVLEPAMQQVSGWMLDDHPLVRWLPELAVHASSPDGLRAMSAEQLAHFDAVVGARTNGQPLRWASHSWRTGPDPHVPLMSDAVLRQMLALTGWRDVRLILDPAAARLLAALPEEPRVLAARHGDDTTLAALVDDPDRRVRQHVARNRRASVETLNRLLDDSDPRVRSQVGRNAGVTVAHLERMCRDADRRVSRAASRELLKRLAAA